MPVRGVELDRLTLAAERSGEVGGRTDDLARLVLVGGSAAERRQEVGRQRDEAFQRESPGDVADMRVEPAILVDDDDGRQLVRHPGGPREIALHLAGTARIGDVLAGDARIVLRDHRGLRRIRREKRRDHGRRRPAAGQPRQLLHEAAPVERQVGVFVIGVDHRLRDNLSHHHFLPCRLSLPER